MKLLRPGQKALRSGQYAMCDPSGGKIKEVTLTKGEPFPRTEKPGQGYQWVDATLDESVELDDDIGSGMDCMFCGGGLSMDGSCLKCGKQN